MAWSAQQEQAIAAVRRWLSDPHGPQVFRLFGYAGTGKTTIAKELAQTVRGIVLFGAFTGKAALVLRTKGCAGASTIHSMIYRIDESEDDDNGSPRFVLNHDSDVATAALVIIDECSMVDEELGRDLLSFGTKVLVLGDPAQLPPVKGAGFFTSIDPEFMLTEIHRQAADNPIIRMSMQAREGERFMIGSYGDSRVIYRADLAQSDVLAADQVLVGLNRTRRSYNARIRQLLGFEGITPTPGDRLVCLRNNKDKGLLNGGLWEAAETGRNTSVVHMKVRSLDDPGADALVEVSVPIEFFKGTEGEMQWKVRRQFDEFDFGYALTCHKSQGSQWPNVMVFDESSTFREDAWRWRYTAITRAAERVTVVI